MNRSAFESFARDDDFQPWLRFHEDGRLEAPAGLAGVLAGLEGLQLSTLERAAQVAEDYLEGLSSVDSEGRSERAKGHIQGERSAAESILAGIRSLIGGQP